MWDDDVGTTLAARRRATCPTRLKHHRERVAARVDPSMVTKE